MYFAVPEIWYYIWIYRTGTVCLGKTKSLGVLKGLSTDNFGIIKWPKHSEGDTWKSAFEWEPKENLEECSHFHQCHTIHNTKYLMMSRCCLHGKTSEFFVTARHKWRHRADHNPKPIGAPHNSKTKKPKKYLFQWELHNGYMQFPLNFYSVGRSSFRVMRCPVLVTNFLFCPNRRYSLMK